MRKILTGEVQRIYDYISQEPEYNTFIYGDIKNNGLEGETVEVFAKDGIDEYEFIVLRYLDNFIIYSKNEHYNASEAAEFLKTKQVTNINGKGTIIAPLAKYFPNKQMDVTYLSRVNFAKPVTSNVKVDLLGADKAEEIFDLFYQIEEFTTYKAGGKEQHVSQIKQGLDKMSHAFGVYEKGKLCAVAKTTAETDISAMVVGVATLPSYRGKGYAMACVQALTEYCITQKGMQYICLFYDNPAAGRIYHKVGFEDIGEYMLTK